MAAINVNLSDTFNEWRLKTNQIGDFVGDTTGLLTDATDVVAAINEVRSAAPLDGVISTDGNEFKVNVDSADTFELVLTAAGNLSVTGEMTSTKFNGPLTGNVTGNLTGAVTGNASTATILQTARTINGASFNGSANITFNTDATAEGSTNLYFTNERARSAISIAATGGNITYNSTSGVFSLTNANVVAALGYTPWHSGNDGAASGLDADLLDGFNSATAATANTIALRDASGDLTATVFRGRATSASYADLAEKYTTDKEYAIGTVIVVSMGGDSECTASYSPGQIAVGVVSENPAFLMNKDAEGQAIALRGRVPVRVIGPITKGQTVIASLDGKAIYGVLNPIAIALETNQEFKEKLVECVIL
jgi:hypothetical protein